jgi:hypothetical protein
MTFRTSSYLFSFLQCFSASRVRFNTIVSVAMRDPHPFVRLMRCLTVANVDSMGFVVRR